MSELREAAIINLLVTAVHTKDEKMISWWANQFLGEIKTRENLELVELLLGKRKPTDNEVSEQTRLRYQRLMQPRRRPGVGSVRPIRRMPRRSTRY